MGKRLLPGTIGERIRDLRTGKQMTQDELAKQLAISKSALSRIESGETATVNSDIVKKLTEILGVNADVVLGLTNRIDDSSQTLPERILNNPHYESAARSVSAYLNGTMDEGIAVHNDILSAAMNLVRDYPQAQTDISAGLVPKNAPLKQAMGQIQTLLTDMKKSSAPKEGTETSRQVVRDIMKESAERIRKKQKMTPETITDLVLEKVGSACGIGTEELAGFRQPVIRLMKSEKWGSANGKVQ